mmetsp:Transcript_100763/g.285625  ORF Transcript_100763/g.285625 Transcript_100763/m.285625 type:complete len:207 (+) Transcript_100763:2409-3029(+)
MVLAQASLRDLVALLERCGGLLVMLQVIALHRHVVVRDREHRVVVLGDRVGLRALDPLVDELQGGVGVLHGLLVLLELREDRADVQVGARKRHLVRAQLDLHLQGLPEVAEGAVEFPNFFVVAAKVVASDCKKTSCGSLGLVRNQDGLSVLELLESCFGLPLTKCVHAILVACENKGLEIVLAGHHRHGDTITWRAKLRCFAALHP